MICWFQIAQFSSPRSHELKALQVRQPLIGRVLTGCKSLSAGKEQHHCYPDQLFLIEAGSQWQVRNDPGTASRYRAQVLQLSFELLDEFYQQYPLLADATRVQAAILKLDPELEDSFTRLQRPVSNDLQQLRAFELLLLLSERGFRFAPSRQPDWADKVRALISSQPDHPWTLDSLAAQFCISVSTLRRRLQHQQLTLGQILREVRLELGLHLLLTSGLGIGQIASRCGYQSHGRFSLAFRRQFGCKPSDIQPDSLNLKSTPSAPKLTHPA